MIFDSQLATLMLKGVDRIQIEGGDSQIHLLNSLVLTTPPIQPMISLQGSGGSGNQSFIASLTTSKTNAGGTTNTLAILQPGLYTLTMSLAARFNYTDVGIALPTVTINIVDGATANPLMGIYSQIGAFSVNQEIKILLNRSMNLRADVSGNGVGQTVDAYSMVSVTRHL